MFSIAASMLPHKTQPNVEHKLTQQVGKAHQTTQSHEANCKLHATKWGGNTIGRTNQASNELLV